MAEVLVLPSHTENFGMVVAEALARGVPVIASQGTPCQRLLEYGCGWWPQTSVVGLAEALRDATWRETVKLKAIGDRGRVWRGISLGKRWRKILWIATDSCSAKPAAWLGWEATKARRDFFHDQIIKVQLRLIFPRRSEVERSSVVGLSVPAVCALAFSSVAAEGDGAPLFRRKGGNRSGDPQRGVWPPGRWRSVVRPGVGLAGPHLQPVVRRTFRGLSDRRSGLHCAVLHLLAGQLLRAPTQPGHVVSCSGLGPASSGPDLRMDHPLGDGRPLSGGGGPRLFRPSCRPSVSQGLPLRRLSPIRA
jgi:hypothetical protein